MKTMLVCAICLASVMVNAQSNLKTISDTTQQAVEAQYAIERNYADSMAWVYEQMQKAKEASIQSLIDAEKSAVEQQYAIERELEDIINYSNEQKRIDAEKLLKEQLEAEMAAVSKKDAEERELSDKMAYSRMIKAEEAKHYISYEQRIAEQQYAIERELIDIMEYAKLQQQLSNQAELDAALEAEKSAAEKADAERREFADSKAYSEMLRKLEYEQNRLAALAAEQAAAEKEWYERTYGDYDNIKKSDVQVEEAMSIEEIEIPAQVEISVYPNPATDYVIVEKTSVLTADDEQVVILNINGSVVAATNFNTGNTQTIDVTNLSTGNYIVRYAGNGQVITMKFVKQ